MSISVNRFVYIALAALIVTQGIVDVSQSYNLNLINILFHCNFFSCCTIATTFWTYGTIIQLSNHVHTFVPTTLDKSKPKFLHCVFLSRMLGFHKQIYSIRFVLKIVFVCLYITPSHYNHCANLSEDIELIKCLSDICLFSVYPFPCDDWENIYTLSFYHHQIGSMNYYPLFRVR